MESEVSVDVQIASDVSSIPGVEVMHDWVRDAVLEVGVDRQYEVSIRVVDEEEGRSLNQQYRSKDYATNVLSFPADEMIQSLPAELPGVLGDIVLCGPVVEREADKQQKSVADHWGHLIIHGTLHLLGHDHEEEKDAREMEAIESRILSRYGIPDPYSS